MFTTLNKGKEGRLINKTEKGLLAIYTLVNPDQ